MKLADLRRLAIRAQVKIHFRVRNGMECVVNHHGVAHVPALHAVPDFNLEDELAAAAEFLLEPAVVIKADKSAPRKVSRGELAGMAAVPSAAGSDHEEE
jgi:hypothetical protein